MKITYSELESKRFGLHIYRGQYEDFNTLEVEQIVNEGDFDIIIVRYPTSTIYEHYLLADMPNCRVIHADSLVYYSAPLQEFEVKPLRNKLNFEVVTEDTVKHLDSLVEIIFSGYQNHYYANPCLQRSSIIDGYLEWAKSFANNGDNKTAWYAKDVLTGHIAAFATCSLVPDNSECEGILFGVMPEYSGRGIYADLIRFTQNYYKKLGVKNMIVSTQLQNYKVQKVWNSHGFKLFKSYETYHIIKKSIWNNLKKTHDEI